MNKPVYLITIALSLAACQTTPTQPPGPQPPAPETFVDLGKAPANQFQPGFKLDEAKSLVDLSINLNEPDGSKEAQGWELVFDGTHDPDAPAAKGVGPYENAWRLWQKQGEANTYAIAIRGTIESKASIKEDLLATTLDANSVQLNLGQNQTLQFRLANTGSAETHLGFSYGVAVLMFHKKVGILQAIKNLPAGSKLYITGHSQGAALATLAHSFLYYAIRENRYGLPAFSLKSYVFAQPKPGNWQYAMDFAKIAGNQGFSYTINNVLDWVPQTPISIEFVDEPSKDIAAEYMKGLSSGKRAIVQVGINRLQDVRGKIAAAVKEGVEKKIQGYAANLDYVQTGQGADSGKAHSINYTAAGNIISVSGADDSSIVSDGVFTQHHATNYKKLLDTLAK